MISCVRRVPEEVKKLVDAGGSLLVKGMAGSGKTSFVLSLLEEFSGGTPVYVSTRLSRDAFFKFFPWAEKVLGEGGFIDARAPIIPPREGRLPLKYASAPEFVESVYFKLKDSAGPRIAVLDSLDALKLTLNISYDDIQLEKLLLEMGEATSSSMVFVSETDGHIPLDYVVDGVVTLRWKLAGNFLLREISIEKIRGERIAFPVSCFTLRGGTFTLIKPHSYELGEKTGPPPVRKIGRKVPTNIDELDEELGGGLGRGEVTMVETGFGVGTSYRWIVIPLVLNAVMQGCPAVFIPSAGFTRLDVENSFKPFLRDEATLRRHIHIVQFAGSREEGVHVLDGTNAFDDAEKILGIASQASKELSSKDIVIFVGTDVLEHIYGSDEAVKMLSRIIASSRANGYTLILTVKSGQMRKEALSNMADVHLKLERINNVTMLQGVNPPTRIYALTVDESEGYFKTRLIPIE
ncbi:MAG: gas vesicle protein GvpD P-loop domain-containing protein [Candidatus Jordarchaeales archaeon]